MDNVISVKSSQSKNVIQKGSFSFGYGDYLRFSKLLLDRCGLYFSESMQLELEYRIRLAFANSTCADLDEFFKLLQDSRGNSVEMDLLVNAVTISETHFFRDTAQFDALYKHVLPNIIERKQSLRTLRIWSAGCASGEEPYSIAMMLKDLIPDLDNWSVTILGTDINTVSLDRARTAVYGNWAFREPRALKFRNRYFKQVNNRFELSPEIRKMVLFQKLNLVEPRYPSYETNTTSMDLIICRNVTIYFSEMVTRWVVDRFYDAVVDGGWLVVGHSEPSLDIYRRFRVRNFPDTTLYQRIPQTSSLKLPVLACPPEPIPPVPLETIGTNTLKFDPPEEVETPTLISNQGEGFQVSTFEQAEELLNYGRSEEALEILLKLSSTQKLSAPQCSLLGQCYANLGQWKEAESWCLKALQQNNLEIDAYYTLSLVLQHQGFLDRAIDAMKRVTFIDRTSILGHYGLATLYHESGLFPQALKSLDNALRLLAGQPDDRVVPRSKGITVGRLREAATHQQQAWCVAYTN